MCHASWAARQAHGEDEEDKLVQAEAGGIVEALEQDLEQYLHAHELLGPHWQLVVRHAGVHEVGDDAGLGGVLQDPRRVDCEAHALQLDHVAGDGADGELDGRRVEDGLTSSQSMCDEELEVVNSRRVSAHPHEVTVVRPALEVVHVALGGEAAQEILA